MPPRVERFVMLNSSLQTYPFLRMPSEQPGPRFEVIELLHLKAGCTFPAQQRHDWCEMIYVVKGHYRVDTGSGRMQGPDDSVFYIPHGVVHGPWMRMGNDRRMFLLRWRDGTGPFLGPIPLQTRDVSGRIRVLMNWMWEIYPGNHGQQALMDALLLGILHEFRAKEPAGVSQTVKRVMQHMRASLSEPLRLKDLADVAGCSEYHFARRFRAETGQAAMKCLTAMRMEAAQSLLRDTEFPLKIIAPRVGLATEQHLSRLVKRHAGLSPRQWREKLRAPKPAPVPVRKGKNG